MTNHGPCCRRIVLGFSWLALLLAGQFTMAGELDINRWNAKVDPPATVPAAPASKSISIPFPASLGNGGDALYPTTPSNFVVIGKNFFDADMRQVWDLSTGKMMGSFKGGIGFDDKALALSEDGAYLAGKASKNLEVRNTRNGRIAQSFDLASPFVDFVDFASNERVVFGRLQDKKLQVCEIKSGDKVCDVSLVKETDKDGVAMSPGRNYLALASWFDGALRVYDLNNGKLVAEGPTPKTNRQNVKPAGLAFSPDGTELAGLFDSFGEFRLVIWNAANGKALADFKLGKELKRPNFYASRSIEWLPDKSAMLILGHAIVDRASGKKVWTVAFDAQSHKPSPRHFLDDETLILVESKPEQSLKSEAIPRDKLSGAMQIVRAGGNAADASLAPIAAADLSGARKIEFQAKPGAWSLVPRADAPFAKRLGIRPIGLKGKPDEFRSILFAGQGSSLVVAVATPHPLGQPDQTEGQPRWIERFDLSGGKSLGKVDMPNVADPIAFAPDGATILLREAKVKDRLDVVNAADAKPVAGWRPYEKESADNKGVAWASFLDPNQVLTVSTGGTLILWTLPKCKATYIADDAFIGAPALSPDRTLVAGFDGKGLRVIESSTGALKGESLAPLGLGNRAEMKAAAFRPDGLEFAGLFQDGTLVVWDLKTGKVASQFASNLPAVGTSLDWSGNGHLLINGNLLVDLGTKRVVWEYFGSPVVKSGPDGRSWLIVRGIAGQESGRLASIDSPDPSLEKAEALLANPKAVAMIRPGSNVSLQLNMNGPPGNPPAFKASIAEAIGMKLKAYGLNVVEDGQPTRQPGPVRVSYIRPAAVAPDARFVINVQEKDTGKTIQYQRMGPRRGEVQTVKLVDLVCEMSLVDATGPVTWMAPMTFPMQPFGFVLRMPAGENDPEIYLKKLQWERVKSWASAVRPPYFVARDGNKIIRLPGGTDLNAEFLR